MIAVAESEQELVMRTHALCMMQKHPALQEIYKKGKQHEKDTAVRIATVLGNPRAVEIHFMPIFSLETRKITEFEALADISGRGASNISADESWIELAASTGVMFELDMTLCQRALEGFKTQLTHLDHLHLADKLQLGLNLHPVTLNHPRCGSHIAGILDEEGIRPERVVIEVTENLRLDETGMATIQSLRTRGHLIDLDGFGKAAATVKQARRLAVDGVKLDLESTRVISGNSMPNAFETEAGLLIRAARKLHIQRIVAEGVESAGQLQVLYDLGATHVQGYHLGKKCSLQESLNVAERRLKQPKRF